MKSSLIILFVSLSSMILSQEICDDGIDNDGDGLIDLLDDECDCNTGGWDDVPSLIPNSNFEDFTSCPSSHSQLTAATSWIQASSATSDYFNTCDYSYLVGYNFLPSNGSPIDNGYIGFHDISNLTGIGIYKEYVGACLSSPMLAGTTYKLKFLLGFAKGDPAFTYDLTSLPSVEIAVFGSSNCADIPFAGFECPANSGGGFVQLASKLVVGNDEWVTVEMEFTPTTNMETIIIGPDCFTSTDSDNQQPYYFADGLTVNEKSAFQESRTITKSGTYCKNNLLLMGTTNPGETIQWYKDGISIVGENTSILSVDTSEEGNYQYRIIYPDNSCTISNTEKVTHVEKQCGSSICFVPNAFTPDNDPHNDVFKPKFSNVTLIEDYIFQIFDKWGALIFETTDPKQGWNGEFKNVKCKSDVFAWKYSFKQVTSTQKENKIGHVNLVR